MENSTFAFVDIETTGISNRLDRIIELAILRVENGKLKKSFKTLVNPNVSIPPFIEDLTGISQKDLKKAPEFSDIQDKVMDLLEDTVFVAHNARFDYNFVKEEFRRHGVLFSAKQLCTVKLFRALNPGLSHYNLDSLISTYDLSIKHRHRAYDDAKAIFDFFKKAKRIHKKDIFESSLKKVLRYITTPVNLTREELESLPETPGVYVMWSDDENIPLYIGKSINIKDRVFSHFAEVGSSTKELNISQQVKRIETFETAGELSALLLESTYVKRYQPLYNRRLRHLQKIVIARESKNRAGYMTVIFEEGSSITPRDLDTVVGIFRSEKQAKETLKVIAKEHSLCPKLLNIEKVKGSCFWHQLKWCKGACLGKERPIFYNIRFIEAFSKYKFKKWPFAGPVAIKEKHNRHHETLIVNKWCIIGRGKWDETESLDVKKADYIFDLDTYKILSRFFAQDRNLKKVHVL